MGQDGEVGEGGARVSTRQGYDPERELAADRRFERRLLLKEATVIAVLLVLVALRIATGL